MSAVECRADESLEEFMKNERVSINELYNEHVRKCQLVEQYKISSNCVKT